MCKCVCRSVCMWREREREHEKEFCPQKKTMKSNREGTTDGVDRVLLQFFPVEFCENPRHMPKIEASINRNAMNMDLCSKW